MSPLGRPRRDIMRRMTTDQGEAAGRRRTGDRRHVEAATRRRLRPLVAVLVVYEVAAVSGAVAEMTGLHDLASDASQVAWLAWWSLTAVLAAVALAACAVIATMLRLDDLTDRD